MAQAVQKLHPGTLLGFGPPIDDGFYYDFLFPEGTEISKGELKAIEKEMRRIIGQDQAFEQEELPGDEALERIRAMGEPHKLEYAQELLARGNETLGFYTNGPFVDMCEGPHVASTSELPREGFKLHSVAGAYWRGDERNAMLMRIYAYAYSDKVELRERIDAVEQAKNQDHKVLGPKLGIYVIEDKVGKGITALAAQRSHHPARAREAGSRAGVRVRLPARGHSAHHQGRPLSDVGALAALRRGHVPAAAHVRRRVGRRFGRRGRGGRTRALLPQADELPAPPHDLRRRATLVSRPAVASHRVRHWCTASSAAASCKGWRAYAA